jgi:alpha-methylacyl-CoA racemase
LERQLVVGPLAGVRVLEIACIGPGPFAGMLLADLGASVTRVDRPDCAGQVRSDGDSHQVIDRGRRSIAVDLKKPAGVQLVADLAAAADVLIEGMRPGVMERLGLGPSDLLARNPSLVYGRMTGWGQDGPDAAKAGHDLNYIALSGALEPIAAPGGGAPVAPLNLLGDFGGGGMLLALGIVSALLHARETGQGQVVDASIVEGTALLTAMHQSLVHNGRWSAPRGENLFDGGAPFYAVYACAEGSWLSVGAIEPKFYADLVDGLGLAEDLGARQWDAPDWPRQRALIAATVAGRGRDKWLKVFADRDACVAPVLSSAEAALHPQLAARGVYRRVDGLLHPMPAPRFSVTPGSLPAPAVRAGENSWDVLIDLGLDAGQVGALIEQGAVVQG